MLTVLTTAITCSLLPAAAMILVLKTKTLAFWWVLMQLLDLVLRTFKLHFLEHKTMNYIYMVYSAEKYRQVE